MRRRQGKVNMPSLEQQFTQAMFDIYRRAKTEAGYNASIFFQMISERGGVRTAKALINATRLLKSPLKPSWSRTRNGTAYSRRRRLLVLGKRLKDYRYEPKG
jgi:hypothetical protein